MEIREVKNNKKQFLSLLLLADEQEDMIDNYDHPIFEDGVQLVDMIYLQKKI